MLAAARQAGFEILDSRDRALEPTGKPWHESLTERWTLTNFKMTPLGRWLTHAMLFVLETLRLVPGGSTKVSRMLRKGADSLVAGSTEGIFTPMFLLVLRKPGN